MKKLTVFVVMSMITVVMTLSGAAQGAADITRADKLTCFSGITDEAGFNGSCTRRHNAGVPGSATLDTNDGDGISTNNYAGLFSAENKFIYGKPLTALAGLRFTYSGPDPGAGAPRFSVGIDVDGDSLTDIFAFIAAYSCNDGQGNVDAGRVACQIFTGDGAGPFSGAAGLAAAYPGAVVASDAYAFIIADEPGIWTISDVSFGGRLNSKNKK